METSEPRPHSLGGGPNGDFDARTLAHETTHALLDGFHKHFMEPTNREVLAFPEAFADIVYKAGYASPIRTPRGEDIMAACGQLKSATERARKSSREIAAEAGL